MFNNRIAFTSFLILFYIGCQNSNTLDQRIIKLEQKIDLIEKSQIDLLKEHQNAQKRYERPIDLIKHIYSERWTNKKGLYLEGLFWDTYREEILRTLEIVELNEENNIGIAFIRYSIGTKVFRTTEWLKKYDGKYWCSGVLISSYNFDDYGSPQGFESWLKSMERKESKWNAESAKRYADL